jgi:hypothetical protein
MIYLSKLRPSSGLFFENFSNQLVASIDNNTVFLFATIFTCLGLSEFSAASQKISFFHNVAKILLSSFFIVVYFSTLTSHVNIIYIF